MTFGCKQCQCDFNGSPLTYSIPGIPAKTYFFCSDACRSAWLNPSLHPVAVNVQPAVLPVREARYFTNINGFRDGTSYLRVDPDGRVFGVPLDGWQWAYPSSTLASCLAKVDEGIWRELTATEAAALLVRTPVREAQQDGYTLERLAEHLGLDSMTAERAYAFFFERERLLRVVQMKLETHKSHAATAEEALMDRIAALSPSQPTETPSPEGENSTPPPKI